MSIKVIIDCDPGTDDAIALMLAAASPELEIIGIAAVAGLTNVRQVAANASRILALSENPAIPVAIGAEQPMVRQLSFNHAYCGADGLLGEDWPYADQPLPSLTAAQIYETAFAQENLSPTVISIGPMTNLAAFIQSGGQISRMITASGNYGVFREPNRVNPRSSWNLRTDPEAADLVFQSVPDITAVGLDISLRLNNAMVERLVRQANPHSAQTQFLMKAIELNLKKGLEPYSLLVDSLAVAQAIRPELSQLTTGYVRIDTGSQLLTGNTIFTSAGIHKDVICNVSAAYEFDFDQFLELLAERVFC